MSGKVLELDELVKLTGKYRKEGKKITLCHGCFDLVHPGHIRHIKAASNFGDILVVSVTEDLHVNKGPGRPVFNEKLRSEQIAELESVDHVVISRAPKATMILDAIKPDFYVKGQDYKNMELDLTKGIIEEKRLVESNGGTLVFTEEMQFSSTSLINRFIDEKDKQLADYLNHIRGQIKFEQLVERFEKISKYKVLVIGDAILDEYQFVQPMGKSTKASSLTAKKLNTEVYAGGSMAVANHIAGFVDKVTLVSSHGLNNGHSYLDYMKSQLKSNVSLNGVSLPGRPTVLKRRLVDKVFKHKLFEIIEIDDSPYSKEEGSKVIEVINKSGRDFDLIIICDFGHGLIDSSVISSVLDKKCFLAVNAQTNSANLGFNLLTKYGKCDFFSIDKEEARLAVHDRHADLTKVHQVLMDHTSARLGAITLGVDGSALMDSTGNTSVAPVLSREVVDTIGAGDAYLSITSLLARQGATAEELAFVGNAVGAMAVLILGNKSFIEKPSLLKYLKTLLTI